MKTIDAAKIFVAGFGLGVIFTTLVCLFLTRKETAVLSPTDPAAPPTPVSFILPDAAEVVYMNNGVYVRESNGSNFFYQMTNLDYFRFPTNRL